MAAYAALVTLSKAIDQILPYEQHYSFLCPKHQMQSLHDKVIRSQEFLEDISGKSSDNIDELESRIRDVAYRLEDIVESILVYSLAVEYQIDVKARLSRKSFFRGLVHKLKGLAIKDAESERETSLDDILGWCVDQDLESKDKYLHFPLTERVAAAFGNSIEEADLLLEEAMKMKKILDNRVIATSSSSDDPPSATDIKVGLDGDLIRILDQITGRPAIFQVVPITGMGGIGKSTLARVVFEHPKTIRRFDVRLWATVSQEYNVKHILQALLPKKEKHDAEKDETVGELIVKVHKQLVGRRYLIILDDVWDEKVWDGVRNAFPNDNNCSRVILTTRLSNVATNIIGSSSTHNAHQMQLLNEEHSWELLRETVYGHGAGCPGEFEDMGRRISRNCKGLPLSLVVIGGLLKLNNAKDHWEDVATSTTAEAAADDDSVLRILSLSYTNLPPQLKACFLYFGMFPEDKEIPTKELVRLWSAEGFLKPRDLKTMEEVAEECLEELVERNLVSVMKKRYNGKIKTSSMHDVLRDLSLRQAQQEKFLYRHHGSSSIDNGTFPSTIRDQPRRVRFREFNPKSSISYNSPIRTFRNDKKSGMIPQFMLVRVLGKVEFSSSAIRNSVRLNNLRYLHLHYNDGESLRVPKSISKLRNLETLFVSGGSSWFNSLCGFVSLNYDLILPVEIWEMPRLRHLVLKAVNMKLPPFLEDSSIEFRSLQTLTGLLNFKFTPRVIQKLQNLTKLKIKYMKISLGDTFKNFGVENLVNLHHLEDLTINRGFYDGPGVRNISFPLNLKKLSLRNTCLPWEKMTSIGDLVHLQVLKLRMNAFKGEVWEPNQGGFPQLKYLKMNFLLELEEWRVDSTHFPSLEKLVIMNCKELKEVPSEIGDIDTLQKLTVRKFDDDSVGRGFEESVRRIEEEQHRVGNDYLQVIILSENKYIGEI